MTRNELELKTVSTLTNLLAMPRKKMALSLIALEARYGREMEAMGYTDLNMIYRAWRDVIDIAELELEAQKSV